jgi:hypothetical protein
VYKRQVLLRRFIELPDRDRARHEQLRQQVSSYIELSDKKRESRRVAFLGTGEEVLIHPARQERWEGLLARAKTLGITLLAEQRELEGRTYRYVVEAHGSLGTFPTLSGVELALTALEAGDTL